MRSSQPVAKILRMSPREIPTIFPSRDVRDSVTIFVVPSLLGFGCSSFRGSAVIVEPVIASRAAKPLPPVLPHASQNFWKPSGPRTDSMASSPSEERRSRYPCPRKVNEASRSKIRKGMEERRRDCASKREQRPAPEMRIGFRVLTGMMKGKCCD